MSKVKGTKIRSKTDFLKSQYGDAVSDRVLASMSADDRSLLGFLVDLGWYDLELYERLVAAIVEVAGDGDETVLEQLGRYSAEDLSQGAYNAYYRSGDPETVLSKMIPIHESLNDPGEMEIIQRQERQLSLIVNEPRSSLLNCRVANAFYRRSVELCEVLSVRVVETSCSGRNDPYCEFQSSWD